MTTTKNGFTLDDALAFIRAATPEERKSLASAIHTYVMMDVQDAKHELTRGDKVSFEPKKKGYYRPIIGTIVAIKRTRVEVKPDSGGRNWSVTPTMLTKLPPTAG